MPSYWVSNQIPAIPFACVGRCRSLRATPDEIVLLFHVEHKYDLVAVELHVSTRLILSANNILTQGERNITK